MGTTLTHGAWQWPVGPFDGPGEFADRLRHVLAGAASQGWTEVVLSDPDFADWPLGERAVVQCFQDWAARGRSLCLIAGHFGVFDRHHARFVQWRRMWDHIIQCRACTPGRGGSLGAGAHDVPSAVWTPHGYLHRIDSERSRGVSDVDAAGRVALRHALDDCFQKGRPAFAASVLGL